MINLSLSLKNLLEYYEIRRYDKAEKLALIIIDNYPNHELAWKILGAIFVNSARINEAVKANRRAIQLAPNDFEAHNNLAIALYKLNKLEEAKESYRQAIALKPRYAEAYNNLGATLHKLNKLEEAEENYRQAIALKPRYAESYYNLGAILKEFGRLNEAEESYRQAISLKPCYAEAYNNLGTTLHKLNKLEEAEENYRQAIALKPDYADPYLNLCDLLEKTNKLGDAMLVIKESKKKVNVKEADFLFYEALILFNQEHYEFSYKIIIKINKDNITEKKKISFLKLKGDLYHHKKDFNLAFETFKIMNDTLKSTSEYKNQEAKNYFNEKRETLFQIKQVINKSSYKKSFQATWLQPTFLIGFPRSGTTLLDTILRKHSKIDVIDEKPMLEEMKRGLGYLKDISVIEEINNTGAKIASDFYFYELKKHVGLIKNSTIIDKLPLNIFELPIINKIFPQAKFILALRHPIDSVFSCWMQNFEMNPAMANMVDLHTVVDLYCAAMETLSLCKKRYSLNIHQIRYEDLVLDFKGEVSNILSFMNLNWEDELRNYNKNKFLKHKINTPSYSQVIKPIYNTATYRWKNYKKHLNTYKKQLEPWVNDYGYLF